jgi:predicted Zn-dependent protease
MTFTQVALNSNDNSNSLKQLESNTVAPFINSTFPTQILFRNANNSATVNAPEKKKNAERVQSNVVKCIENHLRSFWSDISLHYMELQSNIIRLAQNSYKTKIPKVFF